MRIIDLLRLINKQIDECSQQRTDYVMQVLYKYTLRKLYDLLDSITQHGKYELSTFHDHMQLHDFLKEFYAIVKDTNALPLHTPNTGLSQIMMEVALMLEKFFPSRNRFEFLMPSIQVSDYVASGTSLKDPKLKLNDFVMSDDHTCLIEVLNCLKFASEDGILKHTCLFSDKIKVLSASEKQRTINHSKESKEYWAAIQDKIAITLLGQSFGAALMRLARDLRRGGAPAKRDGDELNSGVDANVGIVNFFHWYDELTEEEKNYLDAKKTATISLKEIFNRLRRPESEDFSQTRFCVHFISQHIESIVSCNPDLHERYPKNTTAATIRIKLVTDAVDNAEFRLKRALANPNYKVTATYYASKSSSLLFDNLLQLPDLRDYVGAKTIKEMQRQRNAGTSALIIHRRGAIISNQDQEEAYRAPRRARYTEI